MTQTAWKNRIVGHGEEAPDQLLANPKNWRIHPQHQQEALAGVLDDVGWVQQVVVNQRNQTLIDGHLRVSLALRRNEPAVPVVYVDLSEEEEALILATLDPISALAATDAQQLEALLQDVRSDSAAVQQMLDDLSKASGLYADAVPDLDSYGEPNDRDFWPYLRIQVAPHIFKQYESIRSQIDDTDDSAAFARLLDAVEFSRL